MSTDNTPQRQTIGVIAQGSWAGADAGAVAEGTVRTWNQIARQLAPVIGEAGFRALYTRALHLTKSTYPWLAASQKPEQISTPFTALRESLEHHELTEAGDASHALLATFTQLLGTFIGEGLTGRLLGSVRGDGGPKPEQDTRK
jgi:hypothetical protein